MAQATTAAAAARASHAHDATDAPAPAHVVRHFTPAVAAADCTTALLVGLTAALPISIIDYSIMARVAGITNSATRELKRGFATLLLRPHKFFLPCAENKCALVYAVCVTSYGLTYMGSNLSKSYCQSHGMASSANMAAGVVSGVINTLLSIWKDSIILRALPPANAQDVLRAKLPVPWLTRGLFACRDVLTCVGAFTIAPVVAQWLAPYVYKRSWRDRAAVGAGKTTGSAAATATSSLPSSSSTTRPDTRIALPLSNEDAAQLLTPVALQFVTTIFHITAIRYRQTYPKFDTHDLREAMRKTYVSATSLRMCRILPAFGIGGVMNRNVRSTLLDVAEPPSSSSSIATAGSSTSAAPAQW